MQKPVCLQKQWYTASSARPCYVSMGSAAPKPLPALMRRKRRHGWQAVLQEYAVPIAGLSLFLCVCVMVALHGRAGYWQKQAAEHQGHHHRFKASHSSLQVPACLRSYNHARVSARSCRQRCRAMPVCIGGACAAPIASAAAERAGPRGPRGPRSSPTLMCCVSCISHGVSQECNKAGRC